MKSAWPLFLGVVNILAGAWWIYTSHGEQSPVATIAEIFVGVVCFFIGVGCLRSAIDP